MTKEDMVAFFNFSIEVGDSIRKLQQQISDLQKHSCSLAKEDSVNG